MLAFNLVVIPVRFPNGSGHIVEMRTLFVAIFSTIQDAFFYLSLSSPNPNSFLCVYSTWQYLYWAKRFVSINDLFEVYYIIKGGCEAFAYIY